MVVLLQCSDGALEFSSDGSGWCSVALIQSEHRHPLGADTLAVVRKKLSDGLQAPLKVPSSGRLAGYDVHWMLSLTEQHSSIYAADADGRRLLFFQGADGRLI